MEPEFIFFGQLMQLDSLLFLFFFQDQTSPILASCPGPVYATVEDPAGVSVTFDIPTARDNDLSGNLTLVTSPADITSPYVFSKSTQVSYTFTDGANNSVTCTFPVQIIGKQ